VVSSSFLNRQRTPSSLAGARGTAKARSSAARQKVIAADEKPGGGHVESPASRVPQLTALHGDSSRAGVREAHFDSSILERGWIRSQLRPRGAC